MCGRRLDLSARDDELWKPEQASQQREMQRAAEAALRMHAPPVSAAQSVEACNPILNALAAPGTPLLGDFVQT